LSSTQVRGTPGWQNLDVPAARLTRAFLAFACPLLALAGCGNSRTPLPSQSAPATPAGFYELRYPGFNFTMQAPKGWRVLAEPAPLVNVITSGAAVVAVWRYPRTAPPPVGAAALRTATARLIAGARARDAGLQLIRAKLVRVGRTAAIELDALEQISGQVRRVRSTHVFLPGAELVLDEYAPLALFRSVDHLVFSPVKRSLRLLGPAA
jgi:hypothetical protein